MRHIYIITILLSFISCQQKPTETASTLKPAYAIVIHGGAGTIEKKDMDAATEKLYLDALN
ncbi:MAG TPA: hypothetical protein PJ990_16845, partial [Saprospiraceae bacterium]|nr:hypothetical protein [Saprospiraceae bacterium]